MHTFITHDIGPPRAPRRESVRELHGEIQADDYAWMRATEDPDLRRYLQREREYYEDATERLSALTGTLSSEAAARLPDGSEYSVSWRLGDMSYRTRIRADGDHPQFLRSGAGSSEERVLLDVDTVAATTGYANVPLVEPSPDGTRLAWFADLTGDEFYGLHIRDLETGLDLDEAIERTYPGVAWSADSRSLLYLVADELNRPHQVWRHHIHTRSSADELVFEEPDRRFELTLARARSGDVAIITAASRDTTEVHLVDLNDATAGARTVQAARTGTEYRVDHCATGELFLVTDVNEREFALMRTSVSTPEDEIATPEGENWTDIACAAVAPARGDTRLLQCDVFDRHLLLTVRRACGPLLVVTDHGGEVRFEIAPAFPGGTIRVAHSEEYASGSVIIAEQSLIEPPAFHELDLATGVRRLVHRVEVPGHDPSGYVTERRAAPAADGTEIPVTLAYSRDIPLDGSAPCLLYGYGAYELTEEPEFSRTLPSLLDRGVVYAIAHVRGGGECGRTWWRQGAQRNKPHTFGDYIAVADWLAGTDGSPLVDGDRIATRGLSAGGLLQGAVFSMRPDRWCAVAAEVPFVDCVNTMLDASIPLTITEWDEWGDPRNAEDYACIRSYCPYENLPAGRRPPLLVTGAIGDARVRIHEPAKWVAKLRATDEADSRVLFRADLGAVAHGGPSGRRAQFHYEAEVMAFLLDAMGITA